MFSAILIGVKVVHLPMISSQDLRHTLMSFCGKQRIPSRLHQHLEAASESPLFSVEEITLLCQSVALHRQVIQCIGIFLKVSHTAFMP